jgi:tetratricopeptide (TPR) repeat protein
LGQFLIRSGHINEEQLFKALLEQEMVREPLGRILIDAGLIGESELQRLLQLKCKESVYDCFLWTDGVFAFEDGELPEAVPVSFSLDIADVIQEGLDRMDKWEAVRRKFSSRLTTFVLNRPNLERTSPDELTEEQNKILDLVKRGKNLAEVALELHAIDFYAASRLLELCQLGLIDVGEVPDELPYERQVEQLRNRLAEGLQYFKWGQHANALAAFEAALEIDPHSKAHLFVDKIHRIVDEKKSEPAIPLDDVPRLKVPLTELERESLAPQEGFVLSRVSGDWSVRSILKICPMSEEEVLNIFRRLMDDGLVELHPA